MPAGARPLAVFWGVTLLGTALLAATLQAMGPLPRAVPAAIVTAPDTRRPITPASITRQWNGTTAPPDSALLEPSVAVPGLQVPRISTDGRTAMKVYARPAAAPDGRPRIAILLSGMALSEADSLAAIRLLPSTVTLAISPYATNAAPVLDAARAHGHELLASIPMEVDGTDSAGQHALLTGASLLENQANLEWALGRTQGYAGATGAGDNGLRGERFAGQISSFTTMLEQIARRGLFYVDPRPGASLPAVEIPVAQVASIIDEQQARAEIEAKLAAIERLARERGFVLALAGPPRRAVVERMAAWAETLESRGFVLVPVSAIVATHGQ